MTAREFYVLDAVNIATTRFRRRGHGYEATAAQIAEVLREDDRIGSPFLLSSLEVGATLRSLAQGMPHRSCPLVVKVDARRWRLTGDGCRVLSA